MFDWFKKKALKPPAPQNVPQPGPQASAETRKDYGHKGKMSFTRGTRQWFEEFDLVELTSQTLMQRHQRVISHGDWLEHVDTGISLKPRLVDLAILDKGMRTCTIIDILHPMCAAQRVFEFQHSTGRGIVDSLLKGFDQWAQVDLPVYADALKEKPTTCMCMEMGLPAKDAHPARNRRVVLGPVGHIQQNKLAHDAPPDSHPFCACCLFTKTFKAFEPLLNSDGFFGIRFFASRDQQGEPQADCRVNGEDWSDGKAALIEYVKKWPNRGFELRKQYAVIQSIEQLSTPSPDAT